MHFSLEKKALISRMILQQRWKIVAGVISLAICFDIYHLLTFGKNEFSRGDLFFLLGFGLILPVAIAIYLSLIQTKIELNKTIDIISLRDRVHISLDQAKTWDQLIQILFQLIQGILPVNGITYMAPTNGPDRFEVVKAWTNDEQMLSRIIPKPDDQSCSVWMSEQSAQKFAFVPCSCWHSYQNKGVWCLPLHMNEHLLGILIIFFDPGFIPGEEKIHLLKDLSSLLSLEIERVHLEESVQHQNVLFHLFKDRIGNYLHDRIAQDIAYIHLKLGQLKIEATAQDLEDIKNEIENLSALASQSYQEIRRSLIDLFENDLSDLGTAVEEFTSEIAKLSQTRFNYTASGEGNPSHPEQRRKVINIVLEAIFNIEKHANAKNAGVHFEWRDDSLDIDVWDDGDGFDVEALKSLTGHYGIKIMEQRVNDLNGRMRIASSSHVGTRLSFRFPI